MQAPNTDSTMAPPSGYETGSDFQSVQNTVRDQLKDDLQNMFLDFSKTAMLTLQTQLQQFTQNLTSSVNPQVVTQQNAQNQRKQSSSAAIDSQAQKPPFQNIFSNPYFQGQPPPPPGSPPYSQKSTSDLSSRPPQPQACPRTITLKMSDAPFYRRDEDLVEYFTRFETVVQYFNISEQEMITHCINKFQQVEEIFRSAIDIKKSTNSYKLFKKELLEIYQPSEEELYENFKQVSKRPKEKYCVFLNRCIAILERTKIPASLYHYELYEKLEPFYKSLIKKYELIDVAHLKSELSSIEENKFQQQFYQLLKQVEDQKADLKYSIDMKSKYQSNSKFDNKEVKHINSTQNQSTSPYKKEWNNSPQNKEWGKSVKKSESEDKYQKRYDNNKKDGYKKSAQSTPKKAHNHYLSIVNEEGDSEGELDLKEWKSSVQGQEKADVYSNFPNTRLQARRQREEQERQGQTNPLNNQQDPQVDNVHSSIIHDVQRAQSDTMMQDTEQPEVQSARTQNPTFNPIPNTDLPQQAFEVSDDTCILPKRFFYNRGRFDVQYGKEKINCILTLNEIESLRDVLENSNAVNFCNFTKSAKPQTALQTLSPQEVVNIQTQLKNDFEVFKQARKKYNGNFNLGEHLLLPLTVNGTILMGLLDTGARKSGISRKAVKYCNMLGSLQKKKLSDVLTISGLGGTTQPEQYLYNVNLILDKTSLFLDLPVYEENTFDVLIGQDVLYNLLYDVSIHIHQKMLRYLHISGQYRSLKLLTNKDTNSYAVGEDSKKYEGVMNCYNTNYCNIHSQIETQYLFPSLPTKKYQLILIDLPISQKSYFSSLQNYCAYDTKNIFNHLPLRELADESCVFLFWTSGALLPQTLDLIKQWNITYVTIALVWVKLYKNLKPNLGLGFWTRSNVEHLILAKTGSIGKYRNKNRNISQTFLTYTLFDEKQNVHSAKPPAAYDVIRKVFDLESMTKLELFARKHQEGNLDYDIYGNEVEGFFQPAQEQQATQDNTIQTLFQEIRMQQPNWQLQNFFQNSKYEKKLELYETLDINPVFKNLEEVKSVFMQNLDVFSFDGQPGCTNILKHSFELKPYSAKIIAKPIRYQGKKLDFVRDEVQNLLANNIIEPIKNPEFISPVVVVPKANGKLRFCVDYQKPNQLIIKDKYPLPFIEHILLETYDMNYFCVLDKTSGFWNIENEPKIKKYLAFITQEGVYAPNRMFFGETNSPADEQRCMDQVLGDINHKGATAFLDDTVVYGKQFEEALQKLEIVLQRFLEAKLKLSPQKCSFFYNQVNLLGHTLDGKTVKPQQKKKQALLNMQQPTNYKELLSYKGLLNFLAKYIPNLAAMMATFQNLQSKNYAWESKHSEMFQLVKEYVAQDIFLKIANLSLPYNLYLTHSTLCYGGILTQVENNVEQVIVYKSWSITAHELKQHQYIVAMKNLNLVIEDLKQYLLTNTVTVISNDDIIQKAFNVKTFNPTMQALQLNLQQYDVSFKKVSDNQIKFVKPLLENRNTSEALKLWADKVNGVLQVQEEELLQQKVTVKENPNVKINFNMFDFVIYSDGACQKLNDFEKVGSTAYIVKKRGETIATSSDILLPPSSNNRAEMLGIKKVTEYIEKYHLEYRSVLILSDSQLVVNQITGVYQCNNVELKEINKQIKKFLRLNRKVSFQWIPRELNSEADALAKETLTQYIQNANTAKQSQEIVNNLYITLENTLEETYCQVCFDKGREAQLLLCDHCGSGYHYDCIGLQSIPAQSFYCSDCEYYLSLLNSSQNNKIDPYENVTFLKVLRNEQVDLSTQERQKIEKLKKQYCVQNKTLYYKDKNGLLPVPSLSERKILIKQLHQLLGHIGQKKLFVVARKTYYWPNMKLTVKNEVQSCILCQAKRPCFLLRPDVKPLDKGQYPFQYVALDLFFMPKKNNQEPHIVIIAVCAFSKFVEGAIISNKSSQETSKFLQEQIIFRYGCPQVVRTDKGLEFEGLFKELCTVSGILHVTTTPYFPSSNGQAERTIQTIKTNLRSMYNTVEFHDDWQNLLQLVLFGIRVTVHRGTSFSPAQILFGRDLLIPGFFKKIDTFKDCYIDQEEVYNYVQNFRYLSEQQRLDVKQHLKIMNQEIKQTVKRRDEISPSSLEEGDAILVKKPSIDPLNYQVDGPVIFIRYLNNQRNTVLYYNPKTKNILSASITNVVLQQQISYDDLE